MFASFAICVAHGVVRRQHADSHRLRTRRKSFSSPQRWSGRARGHRPAPRRLHRRRMPANGDLRSVPICQARRCRRRGLNAISQEAPSASAKNFSSHHNTRKSIFISDLRCIQAVLIFVMSFPKVKTQQGALSSRPYAKAP